MGGHTLYILFEVGNGACAKDLGVLGKVQGWKMMVVQECRYLYFRIATLVALRRVDLRGTPSSLYTAVLSSHGMFISFLFLISSLAHPSVPMQVSPVLTCELLPFSLDSYEM